MAGNYRSGNNNIAHSIAKLVDTKNSMMRQKAIYDRIVKNKKDNKTTTTKTAVTPKTKTLKPFGKNTNGRMIKQSRVTQRKTVSTPKVEKKTVNIKARNRNNKEMFNSFVNKPKHIRVKTNKERF